MTVKRTDNVAIVVENLDTAIELYRLCYMRGPEGLLVGLAQQLG